MDHVSLFALCVCSFFLLMNFGLTFRVYNGVCVFVCVCFVQASHGVEHRVASLWEVDGVWRDADV